LQLTRKLEKYQLQATCNWKNISCNALVIGKFSCNHLQLKKMSCNPLAAKKSQILVAIHLQLEKYQLQLTRNWKNISCKTVTTGKISVAARKNLSCNPLPTRRKYKLQPTCN
jgi:hypothetical protein